MPPLESLPLLTLPILSLLLIIVLHLFAYGCKHECVFSPLETELFQRQALLLFDFGIVAVTIVGS